MFPFGAYGPPDERLIWLSSILRRDRRTRCRGLGSFAERARVQVLNGAAFDLGYCAIPYKWGLVRIRREQARDPRWGADVRSKYPLNDAGPYIAL